jgi:hypothetical protein
MSDTPSLPPTFATGDLLLMSMNFTALTLVHGTDHLIFELGFGLVQSGALLSALAAPAVLIDNQIDNTTQASAVSLHGLFSLAASGATLPTSALSVGIWGRRDFPITPAYQIDVDLIGPWTGYMLQLRPN